MNSQRLMISVFSIAAFTVACKPNAEMSVENQVTNSAPSVLNRLRKPLGQTLAATKDYGAADRAEFIELRHQQLATVKKRLDELLSQIGQNPGVASKAQAQEQIQVLQEKIGRLEMQLQRASEVSGSRWEELRIGIEKSCDELEDEFNRTQLWVGNRTPPAN